MALQKIGVLTFHRCINYGSYWQARCLVEGLRAMGHDAVLLDHSSAWANRQEWRCALQPHRPSKAYPGDITNYARKTRQFFKAFQGLPLSDTFPAENPSSVSGFDTIVVGSDEVWNLRHPWYGGNPIFYGEGLRASRLVSYAASFGNQSASEDLGDRWVGLLANFAAVSVRDHNSEQIVHRALGRRPELVVDPCLLFPPSAEPDPLEAETPYVAVYGHSFPRWFGSAARTWAASSGLRLVSIGYRNDWADIQRIATGPERFAALMAGAAAVLTNFFHGCVFSLINAKPFACVSSEYRANKLRDLMRIGGTEERLIARADIGKLPDLLGSALDQQVYSRLAFLRERSREYLQQAVAP